MAAIFDISKRRNGKDARDSENLNNLLKRAHHLIENSSLPSGPILKVSSKEDFIRKLEKGISQEILQKKMIGRGLFVCGIYVPKVIARYLSTSPKSWAAVDYLQCKNETEEGSSLQQGADVCFLICCLFPKRGNWRLMKISYYQKMGVSFYYRFYQQTGKEVGYHMSDNFDQIVGLTNQSINSL